MGLLLWMTTLLLVSTDSAAGQSWCDIQEAEYGWFKCADGKQPWCIVPVYRCDNTIHCQDSSDEKDCSDNAPEAKHRPIDMYCINCNSQQRQWLDKHNDLRRWAGASNMNELNWGYVAFRYAESWANKCSVKEWGEPVHELVADFGQNVARWRRELPAPSIDDQLGAISLWWNEEENYNMTTGECDGVCGHFTAMATAYAREVGCAMQYCDRRSGDKTAKFWLMVCNYRPWPNFQVWPGHPKQPFIEGDSCSKCQPGLMCRNKLCA